MVPSAFRNSLRSRLSTFPVPRVRDRGHRPSYPTGTRAQCGATVEVMHIVPLGRKILGGVVDIFHER